jgi:predicted RNA-binding Zn ribbon-like protein
MKFIAGYPALDFVNTVGGWSSERPLEDKLQTYDDLIRWAELARLLDASDAVTSARLARHHARKAAKVLARARALRGVLHRIFNCNSEDRKPRAADVKFLQDELRIAREHQRLAATGGRFLWTWDKRPVLDTILWRVSQSAADLLTSQDLARVRRCAGENCGWMFLDTTRNHSRHWCDMQDCGNLAKVRRFRARQAQVHPPR